MALSDYLAFWHPYRGSRGNVRKAPRERRESVASSTTVPFVLGSRSSGGLWRHEAQPCASSCCCLVWWQTWREALAAHPTVVAAWHPSIANESKSEREREERESNATIHCFSKRGWWVGLCFVVRRRFRESFSLSRQTESSYHY